MLQIFFSLIAIILLQQRQQEQLSVISALCEWIKSSVMTLRTIWINVKTNKSSLSLHLFNNNISSLTCWHLLDVVKINLTEYFSSQKLSQSSQTSSHWLYRKISMLCQNSWRTYFWKHVLYECNNKIMTVMHLFNDDI